jgi:hypothetical protein
MVLTFKMTLVLLSGLANKWINLFTCYNSELHCRETLTHKENDDPLTFKNSSIIDPMTWENTG